MPCSNYIKIEGSRTDASRLFEMNDPMKNFCDSACRIFSHKEKIVTILNLYIDFIYYKTVLNKNLKECKAMCQYTFQKLENTVLD